jgi:hypothetical protein
MKNIVCILIFLFSAFLINAQVTQTLEKLTPPLRLFFQNYQDQLYYIIERDTIDEPILLGEKNFYKNTPKDTLRWPVLIKRADRFYKSKIGPRMLNNEVSQIIDSIKAQYNYEGFRFTDFQIKEITEYKLFTKYKILVNQPFNFRNSNDPYKDHKVDYQSYYEIISYFDPKEIQLYDSANSTGFQYRIVTINEKLKYGRFSPQFMGLNNRFGILKITQNELFNVKNSFHFTSRFESDWLIGGAKYSQFLIATGLGFGINSFDLETVQFDLTFSNLGLKDKDKYPYELIAKGTNILQNFRYNTLELPVLFKFEQFFKDRNFNISLFAGANLQYINNFKVSQTSGNYEFMGKYRFDFFKDPVILSDLPDYNLSTFAYDDPLIAGNSVEVNKFQVYIEAGIEGKYYFSRNLTANIGVSYLKSVLPLFNYPDNKISFDVISNSASDGGATFSPKANPLFVTNDKTMVDALGINIGFSYYLSKPLIPYTKKGLSNHQLTKEIKGISVSSMLNETSKPLTKDVNFIVKQDSGVYQSFRYTYIGPGLNYFQQGKLRSGKQRDNRLSILVPISGNASLYIEEPYGYDLKMGGIPFREMGAFGQIKEISVNNIWAKDKFIEKYNFELKELSPFDIYIIYYDRGREDSLSTGLRIIYENIANINRKVKNYYYLLTGNIVATDSIGNSEKNNFVFSNKLPSDPQIETLKKYFDSRGINIKRKITFKIIVPKSGVGRLEKLISQLTDDLRIDPEFIRFETTIYPDEGDISEDELNRIIDNFEKRNIKLNR